MLERCGKWNLKLEDEELQLAIELVNFLKSFKVAVDTLSASKFATQNLCLLFRSELQSCLLIESSDSEILKELKTNMREKLDYRFPVDDITIAACLLDHRLRSLNIITKSLKGKDKSQLLAEMIQKYVPSAASQSRLNIPSSAEEPATKKTKIGLEDLVKKHSTSASADETRLQEIGGYLSCSAANMNESVLEFWQRKKEDFPRLAELAKMLFSIPATSTPVERIFSVAGLVVSAKRSVLSTSNVGMLVFVHDNYELCSRLAK